MYNESRVQCRTCESGAPVTYYCEICHGVFCRSCAKDVKSEELTCGNCGSSTILTDSSGVQFCRDCKSQNVQVVTKRLRECPECKSTAVVNIQDKLLEINRDFIQVVQDTREFVKSFDTTYNSFNSLRQKLIKLRRGPNQALHYPSLDGELVNTYTTLQHSFENAWQRLRSFYDNAKRHVKYFGITPWTVTQIPVVENILSQIKDDYSRTGEFLEHLEERFQEDFEGIGERISVIEEIMGLFTRFRGQVVLEATELPVYALECNLHDVVNDTVETRKGSGVVLVTNKRVVFIHESGVFRKKCEVLFSLPLDRLDNVEVRGRFFRKVKLEFQSGEYTFNPSRDKQDQLVDFIEMAKNYEHYFVLNAELLARLERQDFKRHNLVNAIEAAIDEVLSIISGQGESAGYGNLADCEGTCGGPPSWEQPLPYQQAKAVASYSGLRGYREPNTPMNYGVGRNYRAQPPRSSARPRPRENTPRRLNRPMNVIPNLPDLGGNDVYQEPPLVDVPSQGASSSYRRRFPRSNFSQLRQTRPSSVPQVTVPARPGSFRNFSFDPPPLVAQTAPQGLGAEFPGQTFAGTTNPNTVWRRREREKLARGIDSDRQGSGAPVQGANQRVGKTTARELEREIWAVNQALEKLDAQYSSGQISKVDDYINAYRNLQRELYVLREELDGVSRMGT
ncbi:MAG: PH domain-containing protein [Promethearchaeota archaeon]